MDEQKKSPQVGRGGTWKSNNEYNTVFGEPETLPSRLIADGSVVNDISQVLFEPKVLSNGGYVSVDKVVLGLRFFDPESGISLNERCITFQCDGVPEFFESNRFNMWRNLVVLRMGQSSVRVGIGFNKSSGKLDMTRGFVEFNPNRIKDCVELRLLIHKVRRYVREVELKRYDIAVDVPIQRLKCRMRKDKRGYEYIDHGHGVTEYLGTRERPGRVKLYDKQAESLLDQAWTRIEVTCKGDWKVDQVKSAFPKVFAWDDNEIDETTRKWVIALGTSLAQLVEYGEPIEPQLNILSRDARRKVERFLESPQIDVSDGDFQYAIDQAKSWVDKFESE